MIVDSSNSHVQAGIHIAFLSRELLLKVRNDPGYMEAEIQKHFSYIQKLAGDPAFVRNATRIDERLNLLQNALHDGAGVSESFGHLKLLCGEDAFDCRDVALLHGLVWPTDLE